MASWGQRNLPELSSTESLARFALHKRARHWTEQQGLSLHCNSKAPPGTLSEGLRATMQL